MLSCPNADSPANLDAAKEYRDELATFKKKVRPVDRHGSRNSCLGTRFTSMDPRQVSRCVRKSQEE